MRHRHLVKSKQTSAKNGTGIKEMFDSIGYKLLSPENFEEFLRKTSVIRLKSDSFLNSTLNKVIVRFRR